MNRIKQGDWIVYMTHFGERRTAQVVGWDTRIGCEGFIVRTTYSPFEATVAYANVLGRAKP